ncbi:MAG: serine/threonine-protein phosphatase [Acidimicrobiia bacterium]|nr:protein phosphatase 2C domain-containing protein [bacterium]MXX64551.1 serine/threonine-protein phosphatase [Acidimicrobiia bacterium]MCY3579490.1 protein phosphatase 2C domain-containing protein [bacterium]MCY3652266.1 protein phosphatase 2C domain-containing protein [bacterium]MDE0643464.1 protein phosphatase 2C domain-containing protein [bacterium]
MRFVWSSGTHKGMVRPYNEDSIYPEHDGREDGPLLVAVADGLGGHACGDVASRLAIETAVATEGTVKNRIKAANQAVWEESERDPEKAGMGTTLTIAELLSDGTVNIGHVSDSRAYRLHLGRFRQLTRDHTWVQEQVEAGLLTPEQARIHPASAIITRAVGLEDSVEVDVLQRKVEEGDRLLLCSDGLTSMITDEHIAEILGSEVLSDAVWGLIEAANEAGGLDNISVVLVEAVPDESDD